MAETPRPAIEKLELRRDVTLWGSYMWGYADAGIDLYCRDPGRRGHHPLWRDRVPAGRQSYRPRETHKRTSPPGDVVIQLLITYMSLNILIVDDEVNIRKTLPVCLETEGHKVIAVSNFQDALAEASRRSFELAFVDLRLGMEDGLDLIPPLLAAAPWLKIIVITAYASIDTAVEAMRRGATNYIPKPFTPAQVKLAVDKVFEMRTLEQRVA